MLFSSVTSLKNRARFVTKPRAIIFVPFNKKAVFTWKGYKYVYVDIQYVKLGFSLKQGVF